MTHVAIQGVPGRETAARVAVSYARVSTKEQAERDGDPEGYSLPAQLEANRRKAASINAVVVEEFVERGESAKFADTRPELQQMLRYIQEHAVDYVIVHKVDRLARNRLDDAQIHLQIKEAGAQLVSATENIDETPSGMLLHGIMSSIAEFYSRNLAFEVVKGMEQKAKIGGTPGKAPLGYRNVRVITEDGSEVRTVEIDPDRAPLITWAFTAYSTGDWTLKNLAAELERRGLTTRPTPRTPARPVKYNSLHKILSTPYYRGEVTYRSVQYPGRHQPLVDEATWKRVQDVLASHATGEKQREHPHYLKSSVFCGGCGSRLIVTMSKNRHDTVYPYFICLGRHQKSTNCTQRAMLISLVEERIEEHYQDHQLDSQLRDQIEAMLRDELSSMQRVAEADKHQLRTQKERLTNERSRLLQAHYAGAVPLDLLKTEQDRIARQLGAIETRLSAANIESDKFETCLRVALDYATHCYKAYMRAAPQERRLLNQAFFTHIYVHEDDVQTELAEPFKTLLGNEMADAARCHAIAAYASGSTQPDNSSSTANVPCRENEKPAHNGAGLKETSLVELRGLEPLTPTLPVWCATSCAIAPRKRAHRSYTTWGFAFKTAG
ncbi:recombinase [Mycolicibacterium agri]|uniref:Recombinase n=1 Tax=Mycolicibacterium agri TaxID=36811 RepID=A0A7I9VXL1_MYCAG|nr:recombinase [Mycolicibacterium agri]